MIGAISLSFARSLAPNGSSLAQLTVTHHFFISKPYMTRIGTYAAAEAERGGVAERFAASRYMSLR